MLSYEQLGISSQVFNVVPYSSGDEVMALKITDP